MYKTSILFALLLSFTPGATSTLTTVAAPISPASETMIVAGNYNSYRNNWEKAIRSGVISRPSKVATPEASYRLFFIALRKGDDYNATRRLAQYLVIYAERYGVDAALEEESRIDGMMYDRFGVDIRGKYPLFDRIFPSS